MTVEAVTNASEQEKNEEEIEIWTLVLLPVSMEGANVGIDSQSWLTVLAQKKKKKKKKKTAAVNKDSHNNSEEEIIKRKKRGGHWYQCRFLRI